MRWLALSLVLSAGAVAVGCATPCTPATCEGCCAADGECYGGRTRAACGTPGGVCAACVQGTNCQSGLCVAPDGGPDAGPPCGCTSGCCLGDGGCMPGLEPAFCGPVNRPCRSCAAGERCDRGACTSASCAGCFEPTGACVTGSNAFACGRGGVLCVGCLTGERCEQGVCVARPCNPTTCATGCCTLDAKCITPPTVLQCGGLGSDCVACAGDAGCVSGVCL